MKKNNYYHCMTLTCIIVCECIIYLTELPESRSGSANPGACRITLWKTPPEKIPNLQHSATAWWKPNKNHSVFISPNARLREGNLIDYDPSRLLHVFTLFCGLVCIILLHCSYLMIANRTNLNENNESSLLKVYTLTCLHVCIHTYSGSSGTLGGGETRRDRGNILGWIYKEVDLDAIGLFWRKFITNTIFMKIII